MSSISKASIPIHIKSHGRRKYPRPRQTAFSHFVKVTRFLLIASVFGVFGWALWSHMSKTDEYGITDFKIYGIESLNPQDIAVWSGVSRGDNILTLDPQTVETRILKQPYIRNCVVRRDFPNILAIHVVERQPFATLLAGNRAFVIDKEGVVLSELGAYDAPVGPFITELVGLDTIEVGRQIQTPLLHDAIVVLKAFYTTQMAHEVTVSELAVRHVNDIRMFCRELPYEIRWGRKDYINQAQRLDILWRFTNGKIEAKEYCDLRFGRDIACR